MYTTEKQNNNAKKKESIHISVFLCFSSASSSHHSFVFKEKPKLTYSLCVATYELFLSSINLSPTEIQKTKLQSIYVLHNHLKTKF